MYAKIEIKRGCYLLQSVPSYLFSSKDEQLISRRNYSLLNDLCLGSFVRTFYADAFQKTDNGSRMRGLVETYFDNLLRDSCEVLFLEEKKTELTLWNIAKILIQVVGEVGDRNVLRMEVSSFLGKVHEKYTEYFREEMLMCRPAEYLKMICTVPILDEYSEYWPVVDVNAIASAISSFPGISINATDLKKKVVSSFVTDGKPADLGHFDPGMRIEVGIIPDYKLRYNPKENESWDPEEAIKAIKDDGQNFRIGVWGSSMDYGEPAMNPELCIKIIPDPDIIDICLHKKVESYAWAIKNILAMH